MGVLENNVDQGRENEREKIATEIRVEQQKAMESKGR